jgi:predicted Zn finger-like uncharacterized protein
MHQETQPYMSNMVTRCPKCATSFRITSGQLKSAKGAVRCGSCLHIFQAEDYFVSSASAVTIEKFSAPVTPDAGMIEASRPPSTPPVKSAPKAHTSVQPDSPEHDQDPSLLAREQPQTLSDTSAKHQPQLVAEAKKPAVISSPKSDTPAASTDDDFLISDDMELIDFADQDSEESATPRRAPQTLSLFERQIQTPKDDEDQADPDESWAMHLLDEVENESGDPSSNQPDNQPGSHAERQADSQSFPDIDNDQSSFDIEENFYESSASVEEPQDKHEQATPDKSDAPEVPLYASREPLFSLVAESSSTDEESQDAEESPSEKTGKRPNDSRLRAYDSSRAALLMNISPEPLVMTTQHKHRWKRKPLWFLLGGLMILALIVQVAWLQFSTLSRIEPYRSVYAAVCPQLGCTLPELVDRQKIRTYNLVVRNHPHTEDALIVDAIILNTATFGQPFPDLALAFSTIDDQLVATRRFTPDEYLDGELAGKHIMPPNQPIHLTLELADPGPEAVNYHVFIPE